MLKNILNIYLILISALSLAHSSEYEGFDVDSKETHEKYKVQMYSGKKKDTRFYKGFQTKTFNQSLDLVLKSITNFEDKCNNDYKDQRKLSDKKRDCSYHNNNLIESKIYKELKTYTKLENEIDRYLVARRIYNRQNFSHMDLITIFESKDENAKKIITIKSQMLNDKEVAIYMNPPVDQETVFSKTSSEFKLTQIDENTTQLDYYYISETDHWLLNKSVSVSKVFESMAKSIDQLFNSIQKELAKNSQIPVSPSTVAIKLPSKDQGQI